MLFFIAFWLFLLFLMLEMFVFPGAILFVSLSLGFLVVSLASFFITSLTAFLLLWISGFLISIYWIGYFLKKAKLSKSDSCFNDTNVIGMIGDFCFILQCLPENQYLVRYGFEEWSAVSKNDDVFEVGEKALIIRIIGNRIVISKKV